MRMHQIPTHIPAVDVSLISHGMGLGTPLHSLLSTPPLGPCHSSLLGGSRAGLVHELGELRVSIRLGV
jgi:hypothetical protein